MNAAEGRFAPCRLVVFEVEEARAVTELMGALANAATLPRLARGRLIAQMPCRMGGLGILCNLGSARAVFWVPWTDDPVASP